MTKISIQNKDYLNQYEFDHSRSRKMKIKFTFIIMKDWSIWKWIFMFPYFAKQMWKRDNKREETNRKHTIAFV